MATSSTWGNLLAQMNVIETSTFGESAIYSSRNGTPAPFPITVIPTDPLRKEEQLPGNFTLRFINQNDLIAAGCTPVKGDTLTIGTVDYIVEQVQIDAGQGVHLMLLKT